MKTPMKKITVYGIGKFRKTVMERLQKSGCVEFSEQQDERLGKVNVTDSIMQFERYASAAAQAIAVLDEYVPEKSGLFSVRKDISADKFSMDKNEISTVGNAALDIISLKKKIAENDMKIGRENARLASLEQWKRLDIPMNFSGTASVVTGLYTYPDELNDDMLGDMLGECTDYVYCEIISASKEISCVLVVYLKDFADKVTAVLREKGFAHPGSGLSHRTPSDKILNIKQRIAAVNEENEKISKKIKQYADKRDEIKLLYDHLCMRKDKYLNLEKVGLTDETFVIEGYIPAKRCANVKKYLEDECVCVVEFSDPDPEECPVLFSNNSFVKPVEDITRSYSMPSAKDIDPNGIMSIFYYLFFGMMFSDAGYGLLLAFAAGYIGFIKKAESGTKQFMRMFFYCGLSTTFWGLMYGSFFGDAIPNLRPLWINPVEEPLKLLIFSICLGLVQIVVGLIIKFYVDFRAGDRVSAVFDTGSWILILLGAAAAAAGTVFGINPLSKAGIFAAALGAVMILLMKNRETLNPIKRIFSGILGLYDITSYVSDALSYSRLMALGLATGVIAQVVNVMGNLAGGGIIGAIAYALIFVLGHSLNFAINILGAYVHTNRLQYVEFYSKFYEGGGREFSPLKINTKYYNFTEVER